jgi:hypothetical protein
MIGMRVIEANDLLTGEARFALSAQEIDSADLVALVQ